MCANQDLLQRAVVGFITVVRALTDSAFNAFVCVAIHNFVPPFYWDIGIMTVFKKINRKNARCCGIND